MGREEQIINERKRKLEELKKKGINPYPHKFDVKNYSNEIKSKYSKLKDNGQSSDKIKIAGRVMMIRNLGKLIFATVQDSKGKIQIILQKGTTSSDSFDLFKKYIDAGDFVGCDGSIMKTRTGEVSVLVKKLELLSKSLLPLPEKFHGITDKEERYRKRYLDLIMNPEVKDVFETRGKIIDIMREFMVKKGYTDVQTPILQPIYGGGSAKPFTSKLNALDMKVYMRIANELYLKRLIVGGFDKIFEFSIDFRNEGIDKSHNPEFLLFEAMTAYDDYKGGMKLIEDITEHVVKKINGSTKIKYQDKTIDFKTPWKRITVKEAIKKNVKIDIDKTDDKKLKQIIAKHHIELRGGFNRGNAIMALIEEFCEKDFVQPTILYDYPIETSPLAKQHRENPEYTERFEHYVNCMELGNHYSELNNPQALVKNWQKQEEALKKGDEDAQPMDKDFINALEVGMPPTCGIGIGVDRLVMLLTNQPSIRDVILFPFMKPEEEKKSKKRKKKK